MALGPEHGNIRGSLSNIGKFRKIILIFSRQNCKSTSVVCCYSQEFLVILDMYHIDIKVSFCSSPLTRNFRVEGQHFKNCFNAFTNPPTIILSFQGKQLLGHLKHLSAIMIKCITSTKTAHVKGSQGRALWLIVKVFLLFKIFLTPRHQTNKLRT